MLQSLIYAGLTFFLAPCIPGIASSNQGFQKQVELPHCLRTINGEHVLQ
jgi:hypothetical protein